MVFADPLKGELPDDFRANDSYRDNLYRWEFFMLNYIRVGVGSARGGISRYCAFWPDANLSSPVKGV